MALCAQPFDRLTFFGALRSYQFMKRLRTTREGGLPASDDGDREPAVSRRGGTFALGRGPGRSEPREALALSPWSRAYRDARETLWDN